MLDLFSASPSVGSTIIKMMWSLWLTIHQLAFGLKMTVALLFLQHVKENTGIVKLENSVNISIYLYKIYDCHKIVYFWKNVIIGASFNNSWKKKMYIKKIDFRKLPNFEVSSFNILRKWTADNDKIKIEQFLYGLFRNIVWFAAIMYYNTLLFIVFKKFRYFHMTCLKNQPASSLYVSLSYWNSYYSKMKFFVYWIYLNNCQFPWFLPWWHW